MLIEESVLRSVVRDAILKEQATGSVLLSVLVDDIKANPQKYLSSKRNKLETITWKGKKYRALGFLEKGSPVALIKKSDLKPQDASTSGPFQLLEQDKVTLINADDKRVYNLVQYRDGDSVPVSVRDDAKDVKINISRVDYGDPSRADWAIEVGSYIGVVPGVGTPIDLGSAVLAVMKDPPDYLLGLLCVVFSTPGLGLAARVAKGASKSIIKKVAGATYGVSSREISDEAIEQVVEYFVDFLKQKDIEFSESVFRTLKEQVDKTLEYLEKQMKKFAEDFDLFGVCALTESTGSGGCAASISEAGNRLKELKATLNVALAKMELIAIGRMTPGGPVPQTSYLNFLTNKGLREAGEASMKLFDEVVDRDFFEENVKFVHKVGAFIDSSSPGRFTPLEWLRSKNTNATISSYGVPKDMDDQRVSRLLRGGDDEVFDIVELEGHLSYYGSGDLLSQTTSTITPEINRFYRGRPIPKTPGRGTVELVSSATPGSNPPPGTFKYGDNYYRRDTTQMVYDKETFEASIDLAERRMQLFAGSEALLSRWKVKRYIINSNIFNATSSQRKFWKTIKTSDFKKLTSDIAYLREIASSSKNDLASMRPGNLQEILDSANVLLTGYSFGFQNKLMIEEMYSLKALLDENIKVVVNLGTPQSPRYEKIENLIPDNFNESIKDILSFIDELDSLLLDRERFQIIDKYYKMLGITERDIPLYALNANTSSREYRRSLYRKLEQVYSKIREFKEASRLGYYEASK